MRLRRIVNLEPVLWLGAGASCQAEPPLPTLWSLVQQLQRKFLWNDAPAVDDPYQLVDAFLNDRIGTRGDLADFLEQTFRPGGKSPAPGALHRHLAAQANQFPAVIDPNYDLLLRRALDDYQAPYTAAVLDRNLALPDQGLRYLSLHGSWDDWSTIVLTGKSYREFDARYPFLRAQLDILLLRHPVLFVGCSLQDPRLLTWLSERTDTERSKLKQWVAILGPGEEAALTRMRWTDGRTYREVLDHVQIIELPDFATLPRWFQALAEPHRRNQEARERDVAIEIQAEADAWMFSALGEQSTSAPLEAGEELRALCALACQPVPCDAAGQVEPQHRATMAAMRTRALAFGQRLATLLPAQARAHIGRLAASAATQGPAIVRLRVSGSDLHRLLLLPWELLVIDERFPVCEDQLHLVREVVREGAEGLPKDPPPLSVVAHIAAPAGGVAELNLEEAAYRMAVALDPIRDRVRFTEMGTVGDLSDAVKTVQPVLLHFSGHGRPGQLAFEDEEGGVDWVPVERLLSELRQSLDRLPLAVWLSCCHGAGPRHPGPPRDDTRAEPGAHAPNSVLPGMREWGIEIERATSVAADIQRAGIPQVLGYFGPVPDLLAARVDRQLFEALLETGSSLRAVQRARLGSTAPLPAGAGHMCFPLAWSLLALYHHGPDRKLIAPGKALPAPLSKALERAPLELEGIEVLAHGFIGRRGLLAKLRNLRCRDNERVLGLYGLGGLGKTAAMVRLASILTGGGPGWQRRVLAIPAAELPQGMPPFAWLQQKIDEVVKRHPCCPSDWTTMLAVADQSNDRPAELARALLSVATRAPKPLIIYIDNTETLQDLAAAGPDERAPWRDRLVAGFFATLCGEAAGSVTISITTRFRPIDTPGYWESIPRCSNGEIFRMSAWWPVLQRLPWSVRASLAEERLDGHPRAVEWVNSLLKLQEEETGQRVSPVSDPARVWRDLVEPALASLPRKIDQELALDQVLARLAPPSQALLGECTAIGRPVPWDVVRKLGSGHQDKPKVLRDLGLLTRFAADEDAWAVHPFVAERAAQAGLTWTPTGRAVLGRYWRDREAAHGPHAAHLESLTEALRHLAAGLCWSEASALMYALSRNFRRAGWYVARLELLRSITDWPDAQRAQWLLEYGYALDGMSQYDRAEQAFREARSLYEASARASGSRDNEEVASSLHGLANALGNQGRYKDAEHAYLDAIAIFKRVFRTREHTNIAASFHGLANVLGCQKRYEEAERVICDAIDIKERLFHTREHADVAASLHGLAVVLESQGRCEDAECAFRDAIDIYERVFHTREHAHLAVSLQCLANLYESLGRDKDAEAGWREVIAIEEKIFGSRRTANTIPTITALARLLLRRGNKMREARDLAQEAWDAALNGSHLLLAVQALSVLRLALEQSDAPRDQIEQLSKPLLSALQALPADDPLRATIEQQLGLREGHEDNEP